jgi:hypothetical protein
VTFKSVTTNDGAGNQVVVPARGAAADPTTTGATGGGAVVEVYNANGSGETAVVALPATGWTAYDTNPTPRGYRYRSASTSDAIRRVTIKANKLRVRGGGANWSYTLNEPSQGQMAVRLTLGGGLRFCASAPPKATTTDVVDRFVGARQAPPPVTCPPVP